MRRTLHFKPVARLQSILSRELVADPNVALLEFVKNSYDADAADLLIRFDLAERPHDSVLYIADNGDGMDLEGFEENWMRPGFSSKADYIPPAGRRVPVGEKGLGRLAAGRLGDTLDVWTRRRASDRWLHAHFEWSDFESMNKELTSVGVPVDDQTPPEVQLAKTGTVLKMSGLRLNWNARVPGRRAPGRSTTRLGRLRQDLEVLLLPLAQGPGDFAITLEHNSTLPEDESGPVEPPTLALLDYQYSFALRKRAEGWRIERSVRRSPAIAEATQKPQVTKSRGTLPALPHDLSLDEVGSFSGSLYYAPESASRLRQLRAPLGVRLYRDGVRIDPYGEGSNDWLGARAHKAARQGHAAIQPNALYGAVEITKSENEQLVPMANREGLVENEAHDSFIALCQSEFRAFEELVSAEYLEPRWRASQEGKRQDEAVAQQAFAFTLARTAAHAVRQPVAGAGAELDRLKGVIESGRISPKDLKRLQEVHDRTLRFLQRIEAAVEKMLEVLDVDPEPERLDLRRLVTDVVSTVADVAQGEDVALRTSFAVPRLVAEVPRRVVELALEELLQNAIHAPRAGNGRGSVEVALTEAGGRARISVTDDGTGIPGEMQEELFERAQSTRGRVGFGLILTRQLLRLIRGDVILRDTGEAGTTFEMLVPVNGS